MLAGEVTSREGGHEEDVILNGGEAGARDRTLLRSFDGVDGNDHSACSVVVFSIASVLQIVVRSLGGLFALLRMTS